MSRLLVDRYAAGGPLLSYAISGLTPDQATARPGPGAWSLNELVVHLMDADLVMADRIKRVIAEENPTLQAFAEDAWLARFGALPMDEALGLFVASRRWVARILEGCSEADFARVGTHTEAGPMSLAALVAKAVGHLDHHLRFLYAKRGNLGTAVAPHYAPEASTVR